MDIPRLLSRLRYGSEWSMGETYESLVWLDKSTVKPTIAELQAEQPALDADIALAKSEADYMGDPDMPSLQEKVDAILEGGAELDKVKAKIAAVKIKHGRG